MDHLNHLFTCGTVTPNESLLRLRSRTRDSNSGIFDLEKVDCHVVDVGGSRPERGKWAGCIKDVDSVIFVVSLTGYCQALPEDPDVVSSTYWPWFTESRLMCSIPEPDG